jgi:hypothetical protein
MNRSLPHDIGMYLDLIQEKEYDPLKWRHTKGYSNDGIRDPLKEVG